MPITDWNRPLEKPIERKGKKPVRTLLDAYKVLLELPKDKQAEPLPQAIAKALIEAAEGRGPMHTAQAAAAIAVNGEKKRPEKREKKPAKKYKVIT